MVVFRDNDSSGSFYLNLAKVFCLCVYMYLHECKGGICM